MSYFKRRKFAAKRNGKILPILGSFCKGGCCNKTGAYILHKGEYIVSKKMKKKCNLCKNKK